jgi:membrane protein
MFISTFTRNIIDLYSVVYLYKLYPSIKTIIGIYSLIYFLGIFISYLSIKLGNKVGYKYILIFSSIITSITFVVLNNAKIINTYIVSILLSLSIFTYHPLKHYYGITLLNKKEKLGISLILIYLASFFSSYFVIKDIKPIILIIITIIGIIPTLLIEKNIPKKIEYPKNILPSKIQFFIFDQFRILFLLLEPLYLYIISKTISYVGVFNIIITISSIIYLYFITNNKNINIKKYYCYLNILFVIFLLLKLNITNKIILLIIAFFEGIGIKTNELISTMNLYKIKNLKLSEKEGYLIISEIIFCSARAIILFIFYLFNVNLVIMMYILLIGVFILSFQYSPSE